MVHSSHEINSLLDVPAPRDILDKVFSFLTPKEIVNISTAVVFHDRSDKRREFKVAFLETTKKASEEMDIALEFEGNRYDFEAIDRALKMRDEEAEIFPYYRGFISTTQILKLDISAGVNLSYLLLFTNIRELHIRVDSTFWIYHPEKAVSIFQEILGYKNLQNSVQTLELTGETHLDEAEVSLLANFKNLKNLKKLELIGIVSRKNYAQLKKDHPNLYFRSKCMVAD
jgi:hypothetical protein